MSFKNKDICYVGIKLNAKLYVMILSLNMMAWLMLLKMTVVFWMIITTARGRKKRVGEVMRASGGC